MSSTFKEYNKELNRFEKTIERKNNTEEQRKQIKLTRKGEYHKFINNCSEQQLKEYRERRQLQQQEWRKNNIDKVEAYNKSRRKK